MGIDSQEAAKPSQATQSLIHRQIPPMIGGPAVVRHQVYWLPASAGLGDTRSRLPDTKTMLGWWNGDNPKPTLISNFDQSPNDDRLRYCYFDWHGARCLLRIRLHTEYFTVTTMISASRQTASSNAETNRLRSNFSFNGRSKPSAKEKIGSLLGSAIAEGPEQSLLHECHFDNGIEELIDLMWANHFGIKAQDETRDANRILDLRGLITCRGDPDLLGRRASFAEPFSFPEEPERNQSPLLANRWSLAVQRSVAPKDWHLRTIQPYWSKIHPDRQFGEQDKISPEQIEFTASGILGGRALLITHLGKPSQGSGVPNPSRFYLHFSRNDEWQIGRVVDRLCSMATARAALERHAAIILNKRNDLRLLIRTFERSRDGLNHLNTLINQTITGTEPNKDEISELNTRHAQLVVAKAVQQSKDTSRDRRGWVLLDESDYKTGWNAFHLFKGELKDVARLNLFGGSGEFIRHISNSYTQLEQFSQIVLQNGSGILNLDIDKSLSAFPQGMEEAQYNHDDYLEYRVERALYYHDKFEKLSEQLRTERVEGFQNYSEFVQRRLLDAMSYVRNARGYLSEIAAQRTRMNDQIVNLTQIIEAHESDQQEEKIAEIQDFGEFALMSFLLPYYVGYMVKAAADKGCWDQEAKFVFPVLIFIFTLVNLAKRCFEGKFGRPMSLSGFWHNGSHKPAKWNSGLVGINFLSLMAILVLAPASYFPSKYSQRPYISETCPKDGGASAIATKAKPQSEVPPTAP